jgi:predicted nuclease with RNAse H fold/dephospho-CoA kinase
MSQMKEGGPMQSGTIAVRLSDPVGQSLLPFAVFDPVAPPRPTRNAAPAKAARNRRPTIDRLVAALDDPHRVVFLDVETTGLSHYYDRLTLVGWAVGGTYRVHIIGDDPAALMRSLHDAEAIVTFNGTLFDLPFLRKTFAKVPIPATHLDLRYLGRRAGLTGGLKAIEQSLGIHLREGLENVDGGIAVLLWHRYLRGDLKSLRQLIEYNRADVLALGYVLDEVIERLVTTRDLWRANARFSDLPRASTGWANPLSDLPRRRPEDRKSHDFQSLFRGSPAESSTVVGIDLTGSEGRPSGWCVLHGPRAETDMVDRDDEMIARIVAIRPALVSIDSPLSLPFGRTRVGDDDPARQAFGIMRRCERELKRRGINVYPSLLPSMQALTGRGIQLAARLRALGIPVIESYPGAAQDIMGIPRKGAGEQFLKEGLAEFGIQGPFTTTTVCHDELDAITAALVGSFFLAGKYEALAGPLEDALIIPDMKAAAGPLVVGISGRICAGKTTAACALERVGFVYTRFSLVVDDEIVSRGGVPNRELRQRVGFEIHQTKGQRWLCERVLERVRSQRHIVVDGLRFPEDRAFFVERFGSRFLHLHLTAPEHLRRERYPKGPDDGPAFEQADREAVEAEIDQLGRLASVSLENSKTIDDLENMVKNAATEFMRKNGEECRFPLS